MRADKLLEKIKNLKKTFYTISDFEIITGETRPMIRIMLSRLTKRGLVRRLLNNIYALKDQIVDFELLAEQMDNTSYLSFESALARYGIINQIPYAITFATAKKSKTYDLGGQKIIFRKIKTRLFGKYILENGLRIATPEKALLDTIYLNSRGKSATNLEEADLTLVNKQKMLKLAKKYPSNAREKLISLMNLKIEVR